MMTFSILLIPCELITELGVHTSKRCTPIKETGRTIAADDVTEDFTDIELASMAYLLQSAEFVESPFHRIQAGIPRAIKGDECFSCLKGPDHPDIIRGCSVKMVQTYNAGELEVTVQTTNTSFKTITNSFNETKNPRVSYNQAGDITKNGVYWASIMFQRKGRDLLYLEYADQDHIYNLSNQARTTKQIKTEKTKSITRMYVINCSTNKLSNHQFDNALRMYRVIQLENPVRMTAFNESEEKFEEITPDVIYRATLAVKVVDDKHQKTGEFYRYTSCGEYRIIFIVPLIVCVGLIILLGVISQYCTSGSNLRRTIPFSSRAWFQNLIDTESGPSYRIGDEGPANEVANEMVLVEEGRGIWKTKSIVVVPRFRTNTIQRPVDDMEDYDDDDADDLWSQHRPQTAPRRFGRFHRNAHG